MEVLQYIQGDTGMIIEDRKLIVMDVGGEDPIDGNGS